MNLISMTKEEFRELIIDTVKELHIDYEDFIGYSYTDDEDVWMQNINRRLPDTYLYSKVTNDPDRAQLVKDKYFLLWDAYLELKEVKLCK